MDRQKYCFIACSADKVALGLCECLWNLKIDVKNLTEEEKKSFDEYFEKLKEKKNDSRKL